VPNWPDHPRQACVVPIRLGEYSEALGFLVAGIHPGRAFDDAYRQFVNQIADQITIGLAGARAFEQEHQTEREKLRSSEQRLAEASRLYREQQRAATELQIQVDLLQQLPVATWTLEPDGTPDFVNRVWLEFAGQTLDFVRSNPEAWMNAVHPDDRERVIKTFWEGVSSGRGFVFENRSLRAQDETYRWHLQQAVPLRDADGKILKFVEEHAPLRRNVTTEDVGNAAAFLLSDMAAAITGEILYVDAGFSHVVAGITTPNSDPGS